MIRRLERMLFTVAVVSAMGCTGGDKPPVADTLGSIDTVKALDSPRVADSIANDSLRMRNRSVPPAPPSSGALPPPGGETYRRGSSTMSPRDPAPPNDPPPNLIGETRREGSSTMSPTTRRPRDSTVGPRMQIDPQGRVTPIKR
ncbi:MAG: hypothetical protein ABI556_10070 [Gemmatimonadales bacterium]